MRRLKHLLWILPLLVSVLIGSLAVSAALARRRDAGYHASLTQSLTVTSDSFRGGVIPVEYTCNGAGLSPHITWSAAAPARSYAFVMMDWDVPSPRVRLIPVTHWVLYNIPAGVTELPEHVSAAYLQEHRILAAANMAGAAQYAAPCPPSGTHAYQFRVYALDVAEIHPATSTKAAVMDAMTGHILTYGEMVGLRAPGR